MTFNTGLRSLSSKLIASVYSSLAKSVILREMITLTSTQMLWSSENWTMGSKNGCLPDSGSRLPLKRVRIVLESGCLPGGLSCLLNGSELSKKVVAYLVFDQLPPIQLFLLLITLTLCRVFN
ncbi:hypothetical protein Hdeb2414_s0006g00205891 [Helianthus debilis subsp. tardiflorus]